MSPILDTDTQFLKGDNPLAESKDFTPLELRFVSDVPEYRSANDVSHISGYAAMFRKLSRRLGGFHERVMPSAFDESRGAGYPNVVCRYNHKPDFVLGTIHGHTLDLDIQERGFHYDVRPPKHRDDVLELVQRGDVRYSSFAFRTGAEGDDEWGVDENGYPLRDLLNLELVDVAPVLDPAYFDTTATARNMDGVVKSLSRHMNAAPEEVRSMLDEGSLLKFLKRTDRPSIRENQAEVSADNSTTDKENSVETDTTTEEERAQLSTKARNALSDSDFAYIDDKGGRHFPIHDKAHVVAALRLGPRSPMWAKAKGKVMAAAKKFGVGTEEQNSIFLEGLEERSAEVTELEELRAAKASWEDTHACGDCGAKNQYGKHCTQCGSDMAEPAPKSGNKFCPECGGKLSKEQKQAGVGGLRSHEDEETEERAGGDGPVPGDTNTDNNEVCGADVDGAECAKAKGHKGPHKADPVSEAGETTDEDAKAAGGKREHEEESEERGLSYIEASAKMAELRARMVSFEN